MSRPQASGIAAAPDAAAITASRRLLMGRIEPEDLREPERIYLAGSLRLALRVEEWLTAAGVDYAVQVEPFARGLLFGSLRMGAAFYVASGQAAYCRERLSAAGFGRGVVESQE